MKQYSLERKKGCPTCDGVDPKSCIRCSNRTFLCDWWNTAAGWMYKPLPQEKVETTAKRVAPAAAAPIYDEDTIQAREKP